MPSSRAYWKGFLKLSFVSCPIALHPATSAAERLSFRQVNRRTGHRLKHNLVDSITGEAVDSSNKARGYEVGENEFLLVEDRDIERARSERPPPGTVEVSEPPRRESPPTVFAGLGKTMKKPPPPPMMMTSRRSRRARGLKTRTRSRSSAFCPRGRSTRGISRSRITLCRASRSVRNRSR